LNFLNFRDLPSADLPQTGMAGPGAGHNWMPVLSVAAPCFSRAIQLSCAVTLLADLRAASADHKRQTSSFVPSSAV
jgi:hypothetical protein